MDNNWQIYKMEGDCWRWRFITSNGVIIGESHKGYIKKKDCLTSVLRFASCQDSGKKGFFRYNIEHQLKIKQALKKIYQESKKMKNRKLIGLYDFFKETVLCLGAQMFFYLKKTGEIFETMFNGIMDFSKRICKMVKLAVLVTLFILVKFISLLKNSVVNIFKFAMIAIDNVSQYILRIIIYAVSLLKKIYKCRCGLKILEKLYK